MIPKQLRNTFKGTSTDSYTIKRQQNTFYRLFLKNTAKWSLIYFSTNCFAEEQILPFKKLSKNQTNKHLAKRKTAHCTQPPQFAPGMGCHRGHGHFCTMALWGKTNKYICFVQVWQKKRYGPCFIFVGFLCELLTSVRCFLCFFVVWTRQLVHRRCLALTLANAKKHKAQF